MEGPLPLSIEPRSPADLVPLVIVIAINLLFAWACVRLAGKQGRSKPLAFILGLIFSFFALIGYGIIGDSKK